MAVSPKVIARRMFLELNIPSHIPGNQDPEGKTQDHLIFMLQAIVCEDVIGEKAQRWIGYAQCLAVMLGLTTLHAMKHVNLRSKHGAGS